MGAHQSPAGAKQWKAKGAQATIPDAYDKSKKHVPTMLTTDLSLRLDPAYEKISRRFFEHPDQFADAFARAWFKLTHRDMGPRAPISASWCRRKRDMAGSDSRRRSQADQRQGYRGPEGEARRRPVGASTGLEPPGRRPRHSADPDKRGGANGARIRLSPQKDWDVNNPAELAKVLKKLEAIRATSTNQPARAARSFACRPDRSRRLCCGRKAAKAAGVDVKVPFTPGRWTPPQAQTDAASFAPLEPRADGFRNYIGGKKQFMQPEEALVDRAQLLRLSGTGDDGAGWGLACAWRECRRVQERRLHQEGLGR